MSIVWITLTLIGIVIIAVVANAVEDYNSTLKFPIEYTLNTVGIPIIALYNNRKSFNFLVDSGANMSLIDSNILSKIKCIPLETIGKMYGVGGDLINVSYVNIELFIEDCIFEEKFQVVDLESTFKRIYLEHKLKIDGVLGNSFFTKYNGVINFSKFIFYLDKANERKNRVRQ